MIHPDTVPFFVNLGAAVRGRRLLCGEAQAHVAHDLGMDPATICRIEAGKMSRLGAHDFVRLAESLTRGNECKLTVAGDMLRAAAEATWPGRPRLKSL